MDYVVVGLLAWIAWTLSSINRSLAAVATTQLASACARDRNDALTAEEMGQNLHNLEQQLQLANNTLERLEQEVRAAVDA